MEATNLKHLRGQAGMKVHDADRRKDAADNAADSGSLQSMHSIRRQKLPLASIVHTGFKIFNFFNESHQFEFMYYLQILC